MTFHVATIVAYEIKAELGGGFRGVYKAIGGDRMASDVFPTLEAARFWAKSQAWEKHSSNPGYALAALRRKGSYEANIWVA